MLESRLPPHPKEPPVSLPDVDGVITADELVETASTIADWQLPSGMIPWFPGGHADPWNHVEAAMAMDTVGLTEPALKAYEWLREIQRPDGSWHHYYLADGIEQDKLDANCVAYIATGVWHHYLLSEDRSFLEHYWPTVEAAIEFVIELQQPRGEILWARHADGTPWSFALLTGSSSVSHSLRTAIAIAETIGHERPDWEIAAARLTHAIRHYPEAFAPKDRWAMDWYYPVLSGALRGEAAEERLEERWNLFHMPGRGIRCVSDRPWITAAETCECTIAHLAVGQRDKALQLFSSMPDFRDPDGHFKTGIVYPQEVMFPEEERTTYTAAAVILAADALSGATPAATLFTDHDALPELIDLDVAAERDADLRSHD